MKKFKTFLKAHLPPKLLALIYYGRSILSILKRLSVYTQYDSSAFWRNRASGTGQSRVLWHNEEYNLLYRKVQQDILRPFLTNLPCGSAVLDIGCGIGIVSKMMAEINPHITIDAVDFPEMIEVAKTENPKKQINYVASSAESFFDGKKNYDFILSSGCFSAIRDAPVTEKAMANCVRMLAHGGVILMIDPFHRWKYLARVRYSSKQVIDFMRKRGGCDLILKSGVLFWPYREWLCNSNYHGDELEKRFFQGERLLRMLGRHAWADYKILAFKKIC